MHVPYRIIDYNITARETLNMVKIIDTFEYTYYKQNNFFIVEKKCVFLINLNLLIEHTYFTTPTFIKCI